MARELGYERLGTRKLKLVDAVAQSVGLIGPVFSAAFLIPLIAGFGASGKGAGIATPFAVILAAIGTFALGWIVAQYAKRVHAAGSVYDYVSLGLGSGVGGFAGWIYYGGTTILASAIAVLVGWFLRDGVLATFGVDGTLPPWAWSLIYVGLVLIVLVGGVRISTRLQLVLALGSAAVVLAFFIDVIIHAPDNSLKAFNPAEAPDMSSLLFGVLYGVLIFVGFETAANLAEETAEPKRSIPRAVLLSVGIVAVFYVIAAYAQIAGFGFDASVLTDPEVANAGPLFVLGAPVSEGGLYGGDSDTMLKVLLVVVLLDVMAVGLGAATASTRGIFALARDRRIPGGLAATRRGNPVKAAVFVAVVSAAWVVATKLSSSLFSNGIQIDFGTPHEVAVFQWLSTFGGFAIMIVYGLVALGSFRGLGGRGVRPSVAVAGVIGIAVAVGALFGAIYKQPVPFDLVWKAVLIWAVVGVVVTIVVKGRQPAAETLPDLRSAGG
jgi:amino acid transporter